MTVGSLRMMSTQSSQLGFTKGLHSAGHVTYKNCSWSDKVKSNDLNELRLLECASKVT